MNAIGNLLAQVERSFAQGSRASREGIRSLFAGPLQGVLFLAVLTMTGAIVVVQSTWRWTDRLIGWIERAAVVVAVLAMTALVFNAYLMEQTASLIAPSEPDVSVAPPAEPPSPSPAGSLGSTPAPTVDAPNPTPTTDAPLGQVAVVVTGDATEVALRDAAGASTSAPGWFQPGTHTILARFAGYEQATEAGEAEVAPGGALQVKCDSFSETCRIKVAPADVTLPPPPGAAASAPPVADPSQAPPVAGGTAVDVSGDAVSVALLAPSGVVLDLPATVPPGPYTVRATFPGQDAPMDAGSIEVAADAGSVKCDSFSETCRFKVGNTPATASPTPPPPPTPPIPTGTPTRVEVRGAGTGHVALAPDPISLPGDVPPGSWSIQATFEGVGEVQAGTIVVPDSGGVVAVWCTARTRQCIQDEGWYNPWAAEGQVNLALMLMVALGFLGASIATQTREHLSVDVLDRVLSPPSARFVKRLTSFTAAGFCAWMAGAAWERITSPDASGDTFPGAKVWWWMVEPINALTLVMPGDKFGPGAMYPTRSAWEDAMVAQGKPWPYGLAFETVSIGSGFPLWIPILLLAGAFLVMALRFAAAGISPPAPPVPDLPQPTRPGTRKPADVVLAGAFPGAIVALGLAAWLGQGWMIIAASVLLILMGAPLFIGIGIGTLAGWMLIQETSAVSLVTDMFEATKKQEIISIPFFVLAGNLMTHGSIARRLIDFARAVVGRTPGGLAVAAVVACAIFAAISGSSPATVIAIGSIVFPMLVKQGYNERFSLGLLTTSGGLGIIIPPSVPMIVFAVIVSNPGGILGVLSPTDLFLGGFAPGLMIAAMLGGYALIRNWPRPGFQAPLPPGADPTDTLSGRYLPDLGRTFVRGLFALLLPVVVLGGIYGHLLGSPLSLDVTQAAAASVVYAMAVELIIHRELKLKDIPRVCIETAVMIGSLFLILVIAISLNKLLAELEVPQAAAEAVLATANDPITFLIVVNLFLLALGTVMDIVSAILIVAPLLAPIAAQYGIHPVHFGIMFIVNLEIGYLTPPMGINLFVASTTFKRNLIEVIRGVTPFLILMLLSLGLIAFVPRLFHDLGAPVPGLPALLDTQIVGATSDPGRDAAEVVAEARRRLADLRGCVPGVRTRRALATFSWTVGADGVASEVSASGPGFETPEATACTTRVFEDLRLSPLEGGAPVKVSLSVEHIP